MTTEFTTATTWNWLRVILICKTCSPWWRLIHWTTYTSKTYTNFTNTTDGLASVFTKPIGTSNCVVGFCHKREFGNVTYAPTARGSSLMDSECISGELPTPIIAHPDVGTRLVMRPGLEITLLMQYDKMSTSSWKCRDNIPILTVSCLEAISRLSNPNHGISDWKASDLVIARVVQLTCPPTRAARGLRKRGSKYFRTLGVINGSPVSIRQPGVRPKTQEQTIGISFVVSNMVW